MPILFRSAPCPTMAGKCPKGLAPLGSAPASSLSGHPPAGVPLRVACQFRVRAERSWASCARPVVASSPRGPSGCVGGGAKHLSLLCEGIPDTFPCSWLGFWGHRRERARRGGCASRLIATRPTGPSPSRAFGVAAASSSRRSGRRGPLSLGLVPFMSVE